MYHPEKEEKDLHIYIGRNLLKREVLTEVTEDVEDTYI
jgi:hypothetical protein